MEWHLLVWKCYLGLTLRQLTEQCGISKTYISCKENDESNIRYPPLSKKYTINAHLKWGAYHPPKPARTQSPFR